MFGDFWTVVCLFSTNYHEMILTFYILSRHNEFICVVLLVDLQFTVFTTELLNNTYNLHLGVFLQVDQDAL